MPIALLTDFGTRDHYVAAMKGVILTINPRAAIVDITHEIGPQNIKSAAFTLLACYRDFPPGTIFIAVVDPGVGSARRAIAAASVGYKFIGPDNGIFSFVIDKDAEVVELKNQNYFAEHVSTTFHGRDIFAPTAAHLSKGLELRKLGRPISDLILFDFPKPRIDENGKLTGEIIHIDHFGNLITNFKQSDLPERFQIEIQGRQVGRYRHFFAESEPGDLLSIIGSSGFLEIVVNQDSARVLLNAKIGQSLRLTGEG